MIAIRRDGDEKWGVQKTINWSPNEPMRAHAEATISPVCFVQPRSETDGDEEAVSSSSLIFLDDGAPNISTTRRCARHFCV